MKSFFEGECKQEISSGSVHIFQLHEFFQPIRGKDSKHSSGQSYHLLLALLLPLVRIDQFATQMLQIKRGNKEV